MTLTAIITPRVISAAGRYFTKILGTLPEDLVGAAVGDWLRHYRLRNLDSLERKTKEIIEQRKIEDSHSPMSKRFFIEWTHYASMEEDEALQDIWAHILVSSIDPTKSFESDPFILDVVRRLIRRDAEVFLHVCERSRVEDDQEEESWVNLPVYVGLPEDQNEIDYCISCEVIRRKYFDGDVVAVFQKLNVLGLLNYESVAIPIPDDSIRTDEKKFSQYYFHSQIGMAGVTNLGMSLFEAVKDVRVSTRKGPAKGGRKPASGKRKKANASES
jgi:hypothetical protein